MVTKRVSKDGYTIAQASKIVGVSPRYIRLLAEDGKLKVIGKDPLKVLATDVIELKETREKKEKEEKSLGTPSATKSSPNSLLTALLEAQEAGRNQERLAIEGRLNEVRERAERAEQRALEAENARRQAESTLSAVEKELELMRAKKKGFFRK